MAHPAASAYRKQRLETATPAQLIGMLYDALVASLHQALELLAQPGLSNRGAEPLLHAQTIVVELRCSLNFEAGRLARDLDAIYEFLGHQLVTANLNGDPELATSCLRLVEPLREAWAEVLLGSGRPPRDAPSARVTAGSGRR